MQFFKIHSEYGVAAFQRLFILQARRSSSSGHKYIRRCVRDSTRCLPAEKCADAIAEVVTRRCVSESLASRNCLWLY